MHEEKRILNEVSKYAYINIIHKLFMELLKKYLIKLLNPFENSIGKRKFSSSAIMSPILVHQLVITFSFKQTT